MSALRSSSIALTPENPAQRLRRTAAAVRVQFTWWGTHRTLTTQQKQEVGAACAADARLLTAGKRLLDTRHPAFRALTTLRGRMASYWRGVSLPYVEPGVRLIRQADIDRFVHTMGGFREELQQAEVDLNAVYEEIKDDARQRLGRLFNGGDYPSQVQGLFNVAWDFPNVEPPHYLMQVSPTVYAEERARVAARFEEAVQLAEQAFAKELADLVEHLAERLEPAPGGQPKVFRDSAIANFTEFFQRFASLNVRSNPELDSLVERARELVGGVTAEQVRTVPQSRQQLVAGMGEVRQSLDKLVVELPRRRIIRPQTNGNGAAHANGD